jgi:hypothetical protein
MSEFEFDESRECAGFHEVGEVCYEREGGDL